MDWFNMLKNHATKIVALPFLANFMLAAADGHITEQEFHTLASGANAMNLIILAVVYVLLKVKKI